MTQKIDDKGEEDPNWIWVDTFLATPGKMLHQQISVKALLTASWAALYFSGCCIIEMF